MSSTAPVETKPVEATEEKQADRVERGNGAQAAKPDEANPATSAPTRARRPIISRALLQGLAVQLARLARRATVVVVALMALGILFNVLDANVHKWLVSDVENAGKWLASPFQNTFLLHDAKLALALNWAIAILVYAILGPVVAKLVQDLPGRLGRRG